MHSGLLITGLSMLFGSFVIVLICHHCKRRSMRKKAEKTNIPKAKRIRTTVACITDGNSKTAEYLKSLTPQGTPSIPPKTPHSDNSSIQSASSAGSCEYKMMLPQTSLPKSNTTPSRLSVPKHGLPKKPVTATMSAPTQLSIPSIYVESGCYTNTEFIV